MEWNILLPPAPGHHFNQDSSVENIKLNFTLVFALDNFYNYTLFCTVMCVFGTESARLRSAKKTEQK
jgi:hypothetical protein